MYFLGFGDWLSKAGTDMMGAIEVGIRTLSFSLSTIIYGLIIKLYDVFEILCNGRLLNNEIMKQLSTRIGLILGLVMFFYIVFSMIQMLLEPDKINDKEMGAGNIAKKLIIVIVLLGFSNFAFDALYRIQKVVIESHALSNILLPYRIEQDGLDSFGKVLSSELLFSFYQLESFEDVQLSSESATNYQGCKNALTSFNNQVINHGKFDLGYNCLNESVKVPDNTGTGAGVGDREVFIVNYNYIIAPLVGCVAVYLFFMYCFKVGVRIIQLAFLEIISPVAFVSYLAPKKDTMFSKWIKIYMSTYIDVFIRIVIINFVIFLLATIFSESTEGGAFKFWESVGGKGSDAAGFIGVIMILALLTFAKKAPDLLKDLFGSGGPSKLGFGASMKDIVGLNKAINMTAGLGAASAVGLIGGVAGGKGFSRVTGAFGGVLGGAFRGAKAGFGAKGMFNAMSSARQTQSSYNLRRAEAIAGGSTFWGRQLATVQKSLGIETFGDVDSRNLETLNNYAKMQDTIEGYAENQLFVKRLKRDYEAIKEAGRMAGETDEMFTARVEAARQTYKNAVTAVINSSLSGMDVQWTTRGVDRNGNIIDTNTNTLANSAIFDNISSSIVAGVDQLNRELENNKDLFGSDYNKVVSYSTMDMNSNVARKDAAVLTSTKEYAKNQANKKFSTKK